MLKIAMEFRKGILFVRLSGKLTKVESNLFHKQVIGKIEENGIRSVVFNVQALKEIDLKGIHDLYYIYELCKENLGNAFICEIYDSPVFEKIKKNRLLHYFSPIKGELQVFEKVYI
jgi:anti-anti-sigma factor